MVYMLDKEGSAAEVILGMFFGTLVTDPKVHQATILHQSLKMLEQTPQFQVKDFRSFHAKRPRSYNCRRESGYRTASSASSCVSLFSQK